MFYCHVTVTWKSKALIGLKNVFTVSSLLSKLKRVDVQNSVTGLIH